MRLLKFLGDIYIVKLVSRKVIELYKDILHRVQERSDVAKENIKFYIGLPKKFYFLGKGKFKYYHNKVKKRKRFDIFETDKKDAFYYYYREIINGKFFERNETLPVHKSDLVNPYSSNESGFRSAEFSSGTDLVFAGCSYTYGSGVPEEAIWGNVVADSLGLTKSNISLPGVGADWIVESLFTYFRNFGNPKYIFCLLPPEFRVSVPVDGKVLTSNEYSSNQTKVHKLSATWYENQNKKYAKSPFNVEDVITEDFAMYRSIRSIRMLEQYCKSNNIKLIWTTFEKNSWYKRLMKTEFSFDNFFDLEEYLFDTKVIEDGKTRYKLNKGHDGVELDCHAEYVDIWPNNFNAGLDIGNGEGGVHPGTHYHLHVAEAFLAELEKTK